MMKNHVSETDLDAIRSTAMDYADGWYTGDSELMERDRHTSLVKRTLMTEEDGGWTVGPTSTCEKMVQWTRQGEGAAWKGPRDYEVQILDVFRDFETVRCLSPEYVDYLHLGRFGRNGWKIVNVFWQFREADYALAE